MNSYVPVTEELVTPSEMLELRKKEGRNIARSKFVPPVLGKGGFGMFKVKYRIAKLKQNPTAGRYGDYLAY